MVKIQRLSKQLTFEEFVEEHHWIRKLVIIILALTIFLIGNQAGWWDINQIQEFLIDQTKNEFFQKYSPIFFFFYTALPSFVPVPSEVIKAPLLSTSEEPVQLGILFIFASGLGGLFGDTIWFYVVRHGHHFVSSKEEHEDLEEEHNLHRFGKWIYIGSPSLPFVGEIPIVVAAITHMQFRIILPYLFLGNMLRAVIGTLLIFAGFMGFEAIN